METSQFIWRYHVTFWVRVHQCKDFTIWINDCSVLLFPYNTIHIPGSKWLKVPMIKSRVDTARMANRTSCSRTIHFTPARLIPSRARRTATEIPRTAHTLCTVINSAMDSAKPVMYMAPATHWEQDHHVWKTLLLLLVCRSATKIVLPARTHRGVLQSLRLFLQEPWRSWNIRHHCQQYTAHTPLYPT